MWYFGCESVGAPTEAALSAPLPLLCMASPFRGSTRLEQELAACQAALRSTQADLASARADAELANARADEALEALLLSSTNGGGLRLSQPPWFSLQLGAARAEAERQRRRCDRMAEELEAVRRAAGDALQDRRVAEAEAAAAEAADSAAVLQLVSATALRRQRQAAAAERAALDSELARARVAAAGAAELGRELAKERADASALWELVQAQDETLRELTAARLGRRREPAGA